MKNQKGISLIWVIIIAGIIACILGWRSSNSSTKSSYTSSVIPITKSTPTYTLGNTFTFDGFTITIGRSYSFSTVNNQFSEYNGQYAILLPVTVTNNNSETDHLNMFCYDFFGSKGTELPSVAAYFDDSIDWAGDLRSGSTYTKNMCILYDGNGTYSIEFDNYSEKVNVEFTVSR